MTREFTATVDVLGSPMEVFMFLPDATTTPRPGVVLAQHIPVGHTGVENDEFSLVTARRLAVAGYAVAVPFIFHWWDKGADLDVKRKGARDDWMVADCQAAFDEIAADTSVDAGRIAVVGHCWGGRVAWLFACHNRELAACAVFYGGRIKLSMGDPPHPAPIDLAGNIRCPVAGFFGNDDVNPTPDDVTDYAAALDAAGVRYEFHCYDGAGHAFQNFPSSERYRQQASEDAWSKLITFLRRELGL